jgi:Tfp pilus assembly protein PilX
MTGIPRRPSETVLLAILILIVLVVLGILAHAGMLGVHRGVGFRHP